MNGNRYFLRFALSLPGTNVRTTMSPMKQPTPLSHPGASQEQREATTSTKTLRIKMQSVRRLPLEWSWLHLSFSEELKTCVKRRLSDMRHCQKVKLCRVIFYETFFSYQCLNKNYLDFFACCSQFLGNMIGPPSFPFHTNILEASLNSSFFC